MIFVPLLHYFLCKNDYSGNEAEPERWNNCPDMMDCDPWEPPAEPDTANE